MREAVRTIFRNTAQAVGNELETVCLEHWHESILRFFFVREALKSEPSIVCNVECNRIDLVMRQDSSVAFIEFKFYLHGTNYDPYEGTRKGRKGGPGSKNLNEFHDCVGKLHERKRTDRLSKFIVLAYADPITFRSRTYGSDYEDFKVATDSGIQLYEVESWNDVTCTRTNSRVVFKLFEVL